MPDEKQTPKPPPSISNPTSVTYCLSVSAKDEHHKQLWDGEGRPMSIVGNLNKVYRIVCAVYQTNRAAVSEWWVVIRGQTAESNPKLHITRISAALDVETGIPATTTPVIYASSDGVAMLRLSEFRDAEQVVQVTVTTYVNRAS